jgi:hypothetical protein
MVAYTAFITANGGRLRLNEVTRRAKLTPGGKMGPIPILPRSGWWHPFLLIKKGATAHCVGPPKGLLSEATL